MSDSAWMVRAGNTNELVDVFIENGIVAVGWSELGDLSECPTRKEIKQRYTEVYEKRKDGRINTDAGQLHTVINRIQDGDLVLTYDKDAREYYVGTVTGPYQYNPEATLESYPHTRPIDWEETTLSRDDFTSSVQNTLGSALTVFSLENCRSEIEDRRSGTPVTTDEEIDDSPPFIEEVESRSEELISDIVADIDPFDLEELVAAVLRAMGYTAQTTQQGPDYGVDVIAHPDALGFEDPHVKVQVKHTTTSVGNEDIGRFLGTISEDQKGLYVSTGGYTRPALREARSRSQHVTLLDRDDFIDLLLEYYPDLEQEYKAMVPLKQVYIPTEENQRL